MLPMSNVLRITYHCTRFTKIKKNVGREPDLYDTTTVEYFKSCCGFRLVENLVTAYAIGILGGIYEVS